MGLAVDAVLSRWNAPIVADREGRDVYSPIICSCVNRLCHGLNDGRQCRAEVIVSDKAGLRACEDRKWCRIPMSVSP